MTLSPSSESATHLGHYDLIADVFDELDISDLIDTLFPKKNSYNLSHSIVIGSSQISIKTKDIQCLFWTTDMHLEFPHLKYNSKNQFFR
jgi:hypothetical protein